MSTSDHDKTENQLGQRGKFSRQRIVLLKCPSAISKCMISLYVTNIWNSQTESDFAASFEEGLTPVSEIIDAIAIAAPLAMSLNQERHVFGKFLFYVVDDSYTWVINTRWSFDMYHRGVACCYHSQILNDY